MKILTTTLGLALLSVFQLSTLQVYAQMSAAFTTSVNSKCNGSNCQYEGPSILINEMMMSPTSNDGSLWSSTCATQCGEWIELYNPNLCEPVDVSCYYLGNNANDGGNYGGGYLIPTGTIIPPAGFLMIRGQSAPPVNPTLLVQNGGNTVELVVTTGPNVCVGGGSRLWFPNLGGWFAFYDSNGVTQDAVSWGSSTNLGMAPCIPTSPGCSQLTSLPSYNSISADRKNVVYGVIPGSWGQSIRRIPDGGAWAVNQGTASFTPGSCNDVCQVPQTSSCDGVATITVTGGTAPYTYSWNDSQGQLTASAVGLCAGTYSCTVTDANGQIQSFQVEIEDFKPTVTVTIQEEICVNGMPLTAVGSPQSTIETSGQYAGPGMVNANFNASIAGVGLHEISYSFTDENGCHNVGVDTIEVHPLPDVQIVNNQSPYCVEVEWASLELLPPGGHFVGNGVIDDQFSPSAAGVGAHELNYTFTSEFGCVGSTATIVEVVEGAGVTLVAPTELCSDAAEELIQVAPAGGVLNINGVSSPLEFLAADYGPGSHVVTYEYFDANNCYASTSSVIIVRGNPDVNFSINNVFCQATGFVPVNPVPAGGVLTGDFVVTGGIDLSSASPGSYELVYAVTDSLGCFGTDTIDYVVATPLNPSFVYDVDCFQGFSATSTPVGQNLTHAWLIDNGIQLNGTSVSHLFADYGNFPLHLTVTDEHGCQYGTLALVNVPKGASPEDYVMPNVITPNGDGVNDYIEMPLILTECFTYKIIIVNRWGHLVYEMDNQNSLFDGKDRDGSLLSDGVYFYHVISDDFDCKDDKFRGFCSGNITIISRKD